MEMHVDIVDNDPELRIQRRVGAVIANGAIHVAWDTDPRDDLVPVKLYSPVVGRLVGQDEPLDYLRALGYSINSPHMIATDVHDDAHCPFVASPELPMRNVNLVDAPEDGLFLEQDVTDLLPSGHRKP